MPPARVDPSRFQFRDRRGERLVKLPGEIAGLDFSLDGCEDCEVFLLDHSAQIFVDYCRRCTVVIGPVSGSVFLRNCEECRFKICCGQLRTRDCVACDLLLLLPGRPTIEASKRMRFGPLLASYEGVSAHLQASGLARRLLGGDACRWRSIFDFSAGLGEAAGGEGKRWSCLCRAEAAQLEASFPPGPLPDGELLDFPRDDFPEGGLQVLGRVRTGAGGCTVPGIEAATPSPPAATASRPWAPGASAAAPAAPAPAACAHCGAAGGGLQLCAGCMAVRYCGPACQRAAWKAGHKEACRAAAARAVARS
uniref:MYND-type domain-containing protein n=1 Tax=Alexandrium monilatum TaxID=311494 RepID=A0A7S4UYH5_9DINO|mmetsp:Transcript_93279/g.278493  ORF Transcript_93279/g.278493 Transcript_93279/m.278493 type:complete len:308 (+) Transcript_93279:57-980(+)